MMILLTDCGVNSDFDFGDNVVDDNEDNDEDGEMMLLMINRSHL